jgi:hypothetical protein
MTHPEEFTDRLEHILVEEFGEQRDDAKRMIRDYTDIVMQGIMLGLFSLRATAMNLILHDSIVMQKQLL